MSAVDNARSKFDQFAADGLCLTGQTTCGATVVAATGELDASNAHHLTDFTRSSVTDSESLVLDLRRLDFFGAEGIRCLFAIADQCRERRMQWALVPGRPVNRLLRVCDTAGQLPTVASIDQALERFSGQAGRLLQLVAKTG